MATVPFMIQNMTYRHLMEAGNTYRVPPFQRNYAWGEDEWDDLWQDIIGLPLDDAEQSHFMGFLVLHAQESRHFSIIDGQQRLTTLSYKPFAGYGKQWGKYRAEHTERETLL